MLEPTYDMLLVAASLAVSVMASFTGLTLTRGISNLTDFQRKLMIVMASLALGGGIWSMHFVAMLAMSLPLPISYDAGYTLGSALIATLMCGLAFLILHYFGRGPRHIALAGAILGNGIVAMHYVGMSGIRGCLPLFDPAGVALMMAAATLLGYAALWISYTNRSRARIFLGSVVFGISVFVVHFGAMYWTGFSVADAPAAVAPVIGHGMLALLVMLSAFVICGTFMLTATSVAGRVPVTEPHADSGEIPGGAQSAPNMAGVPMPDLAEQTSDLPTGSADAVGQRLPFERDKRTHFIAPEKVAAIRAEGHYTILYTADEKLFCPLSISTIEKRLPANMFMRTHRSYLVNRERVAAFERRKDNGYCVFEGIQSLKAAPVSRGYVPQVKANLGI